MRGRGLPRVVTAGVLVLLATAVGSAEGPLDEVAQMLKSADHRDRLRALEQIEQAGSGDQSEKLALRALRDTDFEVQVRAVEVLGKIGTGPARQALVRLAFEGEIHAVRDASIEGLRGLDPEGTVERLTEIARSSRDGVRKARAIHAAGRLATPEQLAKLRPFVGTKDPRAAAAAARAIGPLAADWDARGSVLSALKPLLGRRGDKKHFLAYTGALDALGAADTPETRAALVAELLQQPDDDPYAPERIARGLENMEAAGVAAVVGPAMLRGGHKGAAERLAWLAGRIGLVEVRPQLLDLLTRGGAARGAAARALGRLGGMESAPALALLLGDREPLVRVEAVTALAATLPASEFRDLGGMVRGDSDARVRRQFVVELADRRDVEALPVLHGFVRDSDWRVSSAAAVTVGTLGGEASLSHLSPLLDHRDWRVRGAACDGLGRLRTVRAVPLLAVALADRSALVRGVCEEHLVELTGKELGGDHRVWRAWWAQSGATVKVAKKPPIAKPSPPAPSEGRRASKTALVQVLRKAGIFVVKARSDFAERLLEEADVPHAAIRAQQLKQGGLTPLDVLLINSGAAMDSDTHEIVEWFVNVGGYLMTSDEALEQALIPCFPGYLSRYGGANTNNMVAEVQESRPGHLLTEGLFVGVPALAWWLDAGTVLPRVAYPARCEVLVDSAQVRETFGTSTLAVTFRYGLGRVQHSAANFYLRESGLQLATKPRDRMVFAADHLGLSYSRLRALTSDGTLGGTLNEATMRRLATDYPLFRLVANFVRDQLRRRDRL